MRPIRQADCDTAICVSAEDWINFKGKTIRQMLDFVLVGVEPLHTLVLRAHPEGANTNIICFF